MQNQESLPEENAKVRMFPPTRSTDWYLRVVLTAIAVSLAAIAFHPLISPAPIRADTSSPDFYIEPGVFPLRAADGSRSQLGKVVVDLRTGKIWGFPTGTDAPYPTSLGTTGIVVSKPFVLGKFDLDAIDGDAR